MHGFRLYAQVLCYLFAFAQQCEGAGFLPAGAAYQGYHVQTAAQALAPKGGRRIRLYGRVEGTLVFVAAYAQGLVVQPAEFFGGVIFCGTSIHVLLAELGGSKDVLAFRLPV